MLYLLKKKTTLKTKMYTLKNNTPSSVPQKKSASQGAPQIISLKQEKQEALRPTQTMQTEATNPPSQKKHSLRPKKVLLSWQAIKFESSPKTNIWYISVFLILVSLVAVGLFTDNFPLAILAILIGLILYLFEKKEAQYFKFGITTEGVFAQDSVYKFSSLQNFWLFYEPNGRQELSLKSQKEYIPYIQIPLGDTDPSQVRLALLNFLPEIEHEEAVADSLENLI